MKFKADFTNVSEGGGRLPAGEYICKVTKAELKDGAKGKYINWELTVGTGPEKGGKIYHITSLTIKALFKLREFMIACGLDVPKKVVDIDTEKIIGRIVGISVIDDTYKDKTTGEMKDTTNIKDLYEVKKTDAGWVRADAEAVSLNNDAPPWEEKTDTADDDIMEIEV